jgi:hypothetical protein
MSDHADPASFGDTESKFDPFRNPNAPSVPRSLVKEPIPETVCEEAQRIVYGDREKTYDHPSRNFERTAHLWNGYLRAKYPAAAKLAALDEDDVAWMMTLLKLARQIHDHKRDNIVDFIGYAACVQKMRDYEDGRK